MTSVLSKEYAKALCKKLGIPQSKWSDLNDALLDAYNEGEQDFRKSLEGNILDGDLPSHQVINYSTSELEDL